MPVLEALRSIVGVAHVLSEAPDCAPYERDWRGRYQGRALAVVRPADTAQVAQVLSLCAANGVAVVPQGGNTGLVGGGVPLADGQEILLSLSRLNRVRNCDPLNNTITVEAGATLAAVQAAADAVGRLFPLSLASEGSCQIGGNLSTNAGGVHVLRYGNTRELTLGLEVVLPDGRIWNGLRGLRKDNTGYDLKQLFIGAEGTLGVITAAVLKLFPRPVSHAVAWLALPDAEAAMALLGRVRQAMGEYLAAFEIVSQTALSLVLQHIPGSVDPLAQHTPWYALIELSAQDAQTPLQTMLEACLEEAMCQAQVLDGVIAASEAQAASLWALRENISEAQRLEGFSIKHDIAVPISCIPAFLRQADEALRAEFAGLRIVAFGHAGDGNLHYNLSCPPAGDSQAFLQHTPRINEIVHDIVHQLGGSISAEHGLGQLKRHEITRYKDQVELDLMRSIKHALDPHGLMNPGKML